MDVARGAAIPVVVVQQVAAATSPIFARGSEGAAQHPVVAQRPHEHLVEKALPSCFVGTDLADCHSRHAQLRGVPHRRANTPGGSRHPALPVRSRGHYRGMDRRERPRTTARRLEPLRQYRDNARRSRVSLNHRQGRGRWSHLLVRLDGTSEGDMAWKGARSASASILGPVVSRSFWWMLRARPWLWRIVPSLCAHPIPVGRRRRQPSGRRPPVKLSPHCCRSVPTYGSWRWALTGRCTVWSWFAVLAPCVTLSCGPTVGPMQSWRCGRRLQRPQGLHSPTRSLLGWLGRCWLG